MFLYFWGVTDIPFTEGWLDLRAGLGDVEVTGGSFTEVKRQGREADHSPPASRGQENVDLYVHSPYVFMA
jgi:hypothetical protein